MLSVMILVALLHVYADEAYCVYLTLRGETVYSRSRWTDASPRAVVAILGTIGLIALAASIARDLAQARFGNNCPRCAHLLLEAQSHCPECGTARADSPSGPCSRLDALAARRPLLAMLLEFGNVAIVLGAFMALAVALLPVARTCTQTETRGIAETNKRKLARRTGIEAAITGSDQDSVVAHAEVSSVTDTSWAPLLPKPGWVFGREIRVRISMQTAPDDAPRDNPSLDSRYRHFEDFSLTARIDSVASYREFIAQLDTAPLRDVDCSHLRRYLEVLMTDFLEADPSDVPGSPPPEPTTSQPARSGGFRNGFDPYGGMSWPQQYRDNPLSESRDPFLQTLVIPMVAAVFPTLVLFWPRRRSANSPAQSAP